MGRPRRPVTSSIACADFVDDHGTQRTCASVCVVGRPFAALYPPEIYRCRLRCSLRPFGNLHRPDHHHQVRYCGQAVDQGHQDFSRRPGVTLSPPRLDSSWPVAFRTERCAFEVSFPRRWGQRAECRRSDFSKVDIECFDFSSSSRVEDGPMVVFGEYMTGGLGLGIVTIPWF
jgi:hypothetical protein